MIQHYLKVAFRNMLKHRTQSSISVLGLAAGLACFALSAFWVRYEMTYDHFHRDAERICLVRVDAAYFGRQYYDFQPYALGNYLKTTYAEIEDFCAAEQNNIYVQSGREMGTYPVLKPDSTFIRMMDIKVLKGDSRFFLSATPEKDGIAITEKTARALFGTTDVIGQTVTDNSRKQTYRISALVSDWGAHSNFRYAFMAHSSGDTSWDNAWHRMLIKVRPGTDIDALVEKMNRNFPEKLKKNKYSVTGHTRFFLEPITTLRYADRFVRGDEQIVRFRYIVYFSVIGVLVILCALVNYLTVYIDGFRARKREMALRKVNGASERSLLGLLSTDFLLTILLASLSGMLFVEVLTPWFLRYSMIADTDASMYVNCIVYVAGMSALALIGAVCSVQLVRRRSLQRTIHSGRSNAIGRICRKGSIVVQLSVCAMFILCTVIMQMQLHHLRHVDVGMDYRGRASLAIWSNVDMNVWAEKLKALPMVTEVLRPIYYPIVSRGAPISCSIDSWDGLDGTTETPIGIDNILAGEEFFRFYDMQLVAGEWITEQSDARDVNIMESTARNVMGWTPEEAIGKHIYYCNKEVDPMTVVGVVKDCAYKSPSIGLPHTVFANTHQLQEIWPQCFVLFKYKPGTWEECRRRIEEMQQTELPGHKLLLASEEEQYNKYLQSEDALSRLLGFSALVCILICVFGIYSPVSLTCEQRRKEIAIRKVNGATVGTILRIFCKEYTELLAVAALIAFPAGYVLMKHWIETYNRQVEIGVWPFVSVFAGIATVIALSIGWRVWQAARQNPAEVVKSE